ncbi:MAG: Mu-like prophage major head subunit gpT family protein [Rhodospirillales bacterium]
MKSCIVTLSAGLAFFAIVALSPFGPVPAEPAQIYQAAVPAIDPAAMFGIGLGGLIVNAAAIRNLYISFSAAFRDGLGQAAPQWELIAARIPASTKEQDYGWLGKIPRVREWIGDRVVQNIMSHGYSIKEKPFELTVGVDRDDIETDNLGQYSMLFTELGRSIAAWPDELIWPFLVAGFSNLCYDGQPFFDTDHPVLDEDGNTISVANTDGGSGTPWFLVDDTRVIKPVIWQVRKDLSNLIRKDREEDENVFNRKEFIYGVDGRANVGYGFWQFAWGSKQTLNAANYAAARAALSGMKGDYGRPLGIMPKKLIVPSSLEAAALEIVNAERDAAGATNVWKGTATSVVVPWLS